MGSPDNPDPGPPEDRAVHAKHPIAINRRLAFTLIELLVVIAIIAILVSLLAAGVMMVLRKGPEVQNRNDILQLSQALQNFKKDYRRYPPSLIRLRANPASYTPPLDQLDKDSLSFLSAMWPQFGKIAGPIPWAGYDPQNVTQPYPIPAGGIILEGDQCLVFFLGGPPYFGGNAAASLPTPLTPNFGLLGGFSIDPLNPVLLVTNDRKKYMDFPSNRLIYRDQHPFPSYMDPYGTQYQIGPPYNSGGPLPTGQPYVYFSSGMRANGYAKTANSLGIAPYAKNAGLTDFYNSDSFQLISAGADGPRAFDKPTPRGGFGPGGPWTPGATTAFGADDISNFHNSALGVP